MQEYATNVGNQGSGGNQRSGILDEFTDKITVADVLVPLSEIFYITDLVLINQRFAS